MTMRCDCGDSECPSCGTGQGTRAEDTFQADVPTVSKIRCTYCGREWPNTGEPVDVSHVCKRRPKIEPPGMTADEALAYFETRQYLAPHETYTICAGKVLAAEVRRLRDLTDDVQRALDEQVRELRLTQAAHNIIENDNKRLRADLAAAKNEAEENKVEWYAAVKSMRDAEADLAEMEAKRNELFEIATAHGRELAKANADLAAAQEASVKPDADGERPTLCEVCGRPVAWGGRHFRCGEAIQKLERDLAAAQEQANRMTAWCTYWSEQAHVAWDRLGWSPASPLHDAVAKVGTLEHELAQANERIRSLEAELRAEHDIAANDPAEQRADRFALEANELSRKVTALEAERDRLAAELRNLANADDVGEDASDNAKRVQNKIGDRARRLILAEAENTRLAAEVDGERRKYADLCAKIVSLSGLDVPPSGMTATEAVTRLAALVERAIPFVQHLHALVADQPCEPEAQALYADLTVWLADAGPTHVPVTLDPETTPGVDADYDRQGERRGRRRSDEHADAWHLFALRRAGEAADAHGQPRADLRAVRGHGARTLRPGGPDGAAQDEH